MKKGYLALVLHAHLPYVRHLECDGAFEENWLFEAMTETYIPLLLMMDGLVEDGVDFRLTLSISPPLISMLGDSYLKCRYLKRLERLIELAESEIVRTRTRRDLNNLAFFYRQRLAKLHSAFLNRYEQNLIQAFKRLQDLGKVEIIATAATHGYLPLLAANPSAVRAQIREGLRHYQRIFARQPAGFWLPECGYCPEIEGLLAEHAAYTILETHALSRAYPRTKHGVYAPVRCPAGTIAFGRDPESSQQVWSATQGYPADYDYREFYRDIAYDLDIDYLRPYILREGIRTDTGFKYCRITGKTGAKEVYLPEAADKKAELHAEDFIGKRQKQIEHLATVMDGRPIVVAPYDAELFGHWWFEGPVWLDRLIRKISRRQNSFKLITLSEYLHEYPARQTTAPSASSWGRNGSNDTWLNERNDWIYPHLHHGGRVMERLVRDHRRPGPLTLRALRQAARELMLAQASDWAFMLDSGKMPDYAGRRIKAHLSRLIRLEKEITNGFIDERWLEMIECRDNIFPDIDHRSFS